jgi:TonB family protein
MKLTIVFCFFIAITLGQSEEDASIPIRFQPDALAITAIDHPIPEYPTEALRSQKQGLVVASFHIDQAGKVTSVEIQVSPDQEIKAAAAKALVNWTFRPAKLHGVAHPALGRLMIYFQCKDASCGVVIPGITDRKK